MKQKIFLFLGLIFLRLGCVSVSVAEQEYCYLKVIVGEVGNNEGSILSIMSVEPVYGQYAALLPIPEEQSHFKLEILGTGNRKLGEYKFNSGRLLIFDRDKTHPGAMGFSDDARYPIYIRSLPTFTALRIVGGVEPVTFALNSSNLVCTHTCIAKGKIGNYGGGEIVADRCCIGLTTVGVDSERFSCG